MEKAVKVIEIQRMRTRFLQVFNEDWEKFLTACEPTLSEAKQLHIGNHIRPQLACWGFMINKKPGDNQDYSKISRLAVSIEAIHKASVIIDDIIDGDTKRRGQPCMHTDFGEYQTVFFAVCMLAEGIAQVEQLFSGDQQRVYARIVNTLCGTIHAMCKGAIAEISATAEQQIDLSFVQTIIDCETAQLIQNSLYMGFLLANESNETLGDILSAIGAKCGYIFQVMNDLEPFCNPHYIKEYKGAVNSDFVRARKTIVLPHLYRMCSKEDKSVLMNAVHTQNQFDNVLLLFEKYAVREMIAEEIEDIYRSLQDLLNRISQLGRPEWAEYFYIFAEELQEKYRAILYPRQGRND